MSALLRETDARESYDTDFQAQMMKGLARNYKETVFSLFRIYSSTGVLNSGITTKNQTPWSQADMAHQNAFQSPPVCLPLNYHTVLETKRYITGLGGGEWKCEEAGGWPWHR